MKSPHELILRKKVKELEAQISKMQYSLLIVEEKWQEFAVSMECFKAGNPIGMLRLYYAPSKKTFRYDFRSLKDVELQTLLDQNYTQSNTKKHRNHEGIHAYVDGSYIAGKVGYGIAIIQDDTLILRILDL